MPSAVGQREVDSRKRAGHVERDSVTLRQHGQRVGPDLVRGVAVGRYPVGADDDQVDLAAAHQMTGGDIRDQRGRDAVLHQLPRRQPGPLQPRACLVRIDMHALARLDRRADHAERRAVTRRGESTGVAVRENAATVRDQLRAQGPEAAVHRHVFGPDRVSLRQERGGQLGWWSRVQRVERCPHPAQRPGQVHCGGAAARQGLDPRRDCSAELGGRVVRMALSFERYAIGGCAADGRCTSHHHGSDRLGGGCRRVAAAVLEAREATGAGPGAPDGRPPSAVC